MDVLRLFLIEDDDDIALLIRKSLERVDHLVTRCRTGADALIVLAQNTFDLVLLDQELPDMTGLDLLRTLAREGIAVPVLMVTCKGDEHLATRVLHAGALDYIAKDPALTFLGELPKRVAESVRRHRLEHMNRLLVQALESARDGIVITDLQGTILEVNHALEILTGYSRQEMLGQTPRLFRSGIHPPEFYARMWQTILSRGSWQGELTNRRKDGQLRQTSMTISPIVDAQGRLTHFVGIQRDITEHKRLEQQLIQAQKMQSVGTLAGGIAHEFNNLLAGINGYASLGLREAGLTPTLREFLQNVVDLSERAATLTRQLLAFARKPALVRQRSNMIDILRTTAELVARTLHVEVALDVPPPVACPAPACSALCSSGSEDGLPPYSALRSPGPEDGLAPPGHRAPLARPEDGLAPLARPEDGLAPPGHRAPLARPEDGLAPLSLLVEADANQLQQALVNLALNARDAILHRHIAATAGSVAPGLDGKGSAARPSSGRPSPAGCQEGITFRLRPVGLASELAAFPQHVPPGDYLLVQVQDTGIGMTAAVLSQALDPFFTTKEVGQGTGLGLPMVFGIVQGHQGFLTIDSEPGKGTCVGLYLPRLVERIQTIPEPVLIGDAEVLEPEQTPGQSILVIDDEEAVLDVVRRFLQIAGHRVVCATTGQEGLEAVGGGRSFDLVILDLMMPREDAAVTFQRIRQRCPQVPVLLCTGLAEAEPAPMLLRQPATGLIRKPFRMNELWYAVKQSLQ